MLGMHAQVAKFNSLDSRSLSSASRLSARQNPPPIQPPRHPSLVEAGGGGGTGLLPLRQTPSRSQVELPVTMRQPLETDGLQTACHVYCCCHKRQESNNTVPQEAFGSARGPANSCLGWGCWGGIRWGETGPCALTHTRTFAHLELTPTLNTNQKCLHYRTTRAHPPPLHGGIKMSRHALQMSSANLSGHATFTAIKQACHLNI